MRHELHTFARAHVLQAVNPHVVGDDPLNLLDGFFGIPESGEDCLGHLGADGVVAQERETLLFVVPNLRGWFTDVVKCQPQVYNYVLG